MRVPPSRADYTRRADAQHARSQEAFFWLMLEKQHVSGAWGGSAALEIKIARSILIALRDLKLDFFAQNRDESD
jgi:hypothetical protein